MKIDLGNFGNNQRTASSAAIDRGDPTAIAKAKQFGADAQRQAGARIANAWGNVAQTATSVGREMEQRNAALAQQQAALQIQRKQLFAQGVVQTAQDQIDAGNLKANDVKKYFDDSMSKFTVDDIDGLHGKGQTQMEKGLQAVDLQMGNDVDHLYRAAHKVETRASVDEMISNTERITLNGGDLAKGESLYDSDTFNANGREAYGAAWGQKKIEIKSGLYKNHAQNAILNSRDSYSGLEDVQNQITGENGLYYGKLDADTQLQLTGQIDNRKNTLEAKAEAAAARAERQQTQALLKQQQRENKATAAQSRMSEFVAAGNVPDENMLAEYASVTEGTSLQTDVKAIAQTAKIVQDFQKAPLSQQKTFLDNEAQQMRAGTNPEAVKVHEIRQRAYEQTVKDLKDDQQSTTAMHAGEELVPVDPTGVFTANDPAALKEQQQQLSVALHTRYNNSTAAKGQMPELKRQLLTPLERQNMKAGMDALQPEQRNQAYARLANSGKYGPLIVKEISGDDTVAAAAYHTNANPSSSTGSMIAAGNAILNDKKSDYKAPEASKYQSVIDSTYGSAIPPSQRGKVGAQVSAYYTQLRVQNGEDPSKFDPSDWKTAQSAVIGDVIDFGDSKVVVPAGTDSSDFHNRAVTQINKLPDAANILGRVDSGEATLRAVGPKTYMIIKPSGAAYLSATDNKPLQIEMP